MSDRIPMFPFKPPPRADEDTAVIEQVLESVPGQVEMDSVIKAQSSAPQVVERMVKLENCVWSLASAILLLPDSAMESDARRQLIEQARSLLLESKVLDHNLELPLRPDPAQVDTGVSAIATLFPPSENP
ncbi:MAG: hypothetical protein WBF56_15550 [Candidatus Acidiferrales bacterium]